MQIGRLLRILLLPLLYLLSACSHTPSPIIELNPVDSTESVEDSTTTEQAEEGVEPTPPPSPITAEDLKAPIYLLAKDGKVYATPREVDPGKYLRMALISEKAYFAVPGDDPYDVKRPQGVADSTNGLMSIPLNGGRRLLYPSYELDEPYGDRTAMDSRTLLLDSVLLLGQLDDYPSVRSEAQGEEDGEEDYDTFCKSCGEFYYMGDIPEADLLEVEQAMGDMLNYHFVDRISGQVILCGPGFGFLPFIAPDASYIIAVGKRWYENESGINLQVIRLGKVGERRLILELYIPGIHFIPSNSGWLDDGDAPFVSQGAVYARVYKEAPDGQEPARQYIRIGLKCLQGGRLHD